MNSENWAAWFSKVVLALTRLSAKPGSKTKSFKCWRMTFPSNDFKINCKCLDLCKFNRHWAIWMLKTCFHKWNKNLKKSWWNYCWIFLVLQFIVWNLISRCTVSLGWFYFPLVLMCILYLILTVWKFENFTFIRFFVKSINQRNHCNFHIICQNKRSNFRENEITKNHFT